MQFAEASSVQLPYDTLPCRRVNLGAQSSRHTPCAVTKEAVVDLATNSKSVARRADFFLARSVSEGDHENDRALKRPREAETGHRGPPR
jgi:hypothetical protein